eukprot:Seg888.25 transcript_id=Seg888.25/GoldUCD/mRNA.D3Y31 product="hypothetical protein" protein_id=Seg888.25/GoldUCD/D3Y31
MEQSPDKDPFVLPAGNAQFRSRNDAIFGSLTALEQKHENVTPKDDPFSEADVAEKQRRKPRRPAMVPDHVLHPQKYTKYSLEEDGTKSYGHGADDGSRLSSSQGDQLNKRVALDFLKDLKERKIKDQKDTNKEDDDVSPEKSSLKRKRDQVIADEEQAGRESLGSDEAKSSTGSSGACHKMQTYEFGRRHENKEGKNLHKTDIDVEVGKELNLSHLEDEKSDLITDADVASISDNSKSKFSKSRKVKRNLRKSHHSEEDDQ